VALDTAARHAGNFMFNREKQVEHLHGVMGREPSVVSPYDAELFGHWWFEGPQFLDYLFRKMHFDQHSLEPITPVGYLERQARNQVAMPSFSSWGYKGYAEFWLEGSNDWIYRHLDHAVRDMIALANAHPDANGQHGRALNQAARELLLAQASDWAFIMKTGTMVPYAVRRTKDHLNRFDRLAGMIRTGSVHEDTLRELEARDNLFPAIDYRVYRSR
jgi:1,4-alpha-glucan branching enzyme